MVNPDYKLDSTIGYETSHQSPRVVDMSRIYLPGLYNDPRVVKSLREGKLVMSEIENLIF
ncbi:MAG: hypothetical protein Q8N99_06575 [Nanoarchaeota archaeon]|nr:hypothetical protein [Nanoarchaeota archaeon]